MGRVNLELLEHRLGGWCEACALPSVHVAIWVAICDGRVLSVTSVAECDNCRTRPDPATIR